MTEHAQKKQTRRWFLGRGKKNNKQM